MKNGAKYKMYSLRSYTAPGYLILEPRLVLKEIRKLRRCLILNGMKGGVTSGQDPTQLSFQLVKGKGLRNVLLLKTTNELSVAAHTFTPARGKQRQAHLCA